MWLRAQGLVSPTEIEVVNYMNFMGIANDATVYYASTPQEITGAQIWTAVNNYVLALKAADIAGVNWTNIATATCVMLRDNLFIGGTALRHSYNLADPTKNLTFFGSWVHNAFGIVGNGANTYANDGIRDADLSNLTRLYHGYTSLDGGAPAGGGMWLGGSRPSPGLPELSYLRISTNTYGCANSNIASAGLFTGQTVFTGDFAQLRQGTGANSNRNFFNGSLVNTSQFSNTPTATNLDLYVGGLNQNGSLVNPFLGDIRHHFLANELSTSQHNAWYTARNALQTALNRVP